MAHPRAVLRFSDCFGIQIRCVRPGIGHSGLAGCGADKLIGCLNRLVSTHNSCVLDGFLSPKFVGERERELE